MLKGAIDPRLAEKEETSSLVSVPKEELACIQLCQKEQLQQTSWKGDLSKVSNIAKSVSRRGNMVGVTAHEGDQ